MNSASWLSECDVALAHRGRRYPTEKVCARALALDTNLARPLLGLARLSLAAGNRAGALEQLAAAQRRLAANDQTQDLEPPPHVSRRRSSGRRR